MEKKSGAEMPAEASNAYKTLVAIFAILSEAEKRHFTASGQMASFINELVARGGDDEECQKRTQAFTGTEISQISLPRPDDAANFKKKCTEAIEAYETICHDSYTQALREVEIDNKAWLTHRKQEMTKEAATAAEEGRPTDFEGASGWAGPSPAERELMDPRRWAIPDVPPTPQMAIESTREAAAKASMALSSAGKEKLTRDMDRESVNNRVMRPMTDHYSGQNY